MPHSVLRDLFFQFVNNFWSHVAADVLSRTGFQGKGISGTEEESNEIRKRFASLWVGSASVDALNTERVNDHH